MSDRDPVRILQVVGGMNRAGVETWLMHVLRHIDRERFRMDFLVHTEEPCAYDDEIRALGSRIIPCMHPSRPWIYAKNFRQILKEFGPYNVVHSHVYYFSGYVLRLAAKAGVPARIAHSHSTADGRQDTIYRRIYRKLNKRWIFKYATSGIAASRNAASELFGIHWESDQRWKVIYCGIDLDPFRKTIEKTKVREELGIPLESKVIGHVGRFNKPKNHTFLVQIAAELAKSDQSIWFLLVGDGPLRPNVEQQVSDLGLSNRFVFAGVREDVPRLMMGAMDVFLFPSLYEGLGIVLLEAQAAGLPCITSDVVPRESEVVSDLISYLPLSEDPGYWARHVEEAIENPRQDRSKCLEAIEKKGYSIESSLNKLKNIFNS